ncbi:MAG: hypothetical protein LBC19_00455, partial [Tannerella sp.]|nr:hypothetical protein [Tannerella sp.]
MKTMDYAKEWQKIDSLMRKKRNRSALKNAAKVYDYALGSKDYAQAIKAITCRIVNQAALGETGQTMFDSLQQDVKRMPQPAKSVVYAIIADAYRKYHTNNWRQIRLRTRVAVTDGDIETWDITRLFEEALKYYRLSIQDENILQQTSLDDYGEIADYTLDTTLHRIVLPTLYDFLVFNAIEAFKSELSHFLPRHIFVLDKPEYFADVNTFVDYKIEMPDSLRLIRYNAAGTLIEDKIEAPDSPSAEYIVINLYRELLKFRLQDSGNKAALISLDVERLRYVYDNGKHADNDAMYENVLKSQMDACGQSDEWTYPALALAILYEKQGHEGGENSKLRYRYKESYGLCKKIFSLCDGKDEMKAIVEMTKILWERIAEPFVDITFQQLQYPDSPILALVKYKNIDKLHLKIYG